MKIKMIRGIAEKLPRGYDIVPEEMKRTVGNSDTYYYGAKLCNEFRQKVLETDISVTDCVEVDKKKLYEMVDNNLQWKVFASKQEFNTLVEAIAKSDCLKWRSV